MLTIHLFGHPEIWRDGKSINVQRRKSRAMFYYLAATEKPLVREQLLNMFWGDLERSSALQTLRTTLYGLRQDIADALITDEDQVFLSPKAQVDVHQFSSILTRAEPEADQMRNAIRLYRGEFLEGFDLPDTPPFEDWLSLQREYYRRMVLRAHAKLSQRYEQQGDYVKALDSLERALAFDALQEDLQRNVLRLLYLNGDRPAAIRRYDRLRKMLDEELGVPPMAETRKQYDAILNGSLKATSEPSISKPKPLILESKPKATSPLLPFTGRAAEIDKTHSLEGSQRLILIEGEPGIGKTRLALEAIQKIKRLPLQGAARELEHSLPYQPMVEAFRSLVNREDWPHLKKQIQNNLPTIWQYEVSRILPELDPGKPGIAPSSFAGATTTADESRLWEGVNQFLLTLSQIIPLLLFLDDLHWADAATLGMLGYLIRQSERGSVFFLATSRLMTSRSAFTALLSSLTREGGLERLTLSKLSLEDVITIARQLSPDYAYPLADWLMRNSEGSPYVLVELIRYAYQNDVLKRPSEAQPGQLNVSALSTSPIVPHTVYSMIQTQYESLSDPAKRILDTAVAVGREFDFEVVVRAAGLSETNGLDAINELIEKGMIYTKENHFEFSHNMLMEVAYREIGEIRHRILHRRVAEAMESIYNPTKLEKNAGLIAAHFMEGRAKDRAAPYALRAGERAVRLAAWVEASSFFEQALEGAKKEEKFNILMLLGDARAKGGQSNQASEAFHDALTLATEINSLKEINRARLALAQTMLSQARFEEAIYLAKEVIKDPDPTNAFHAQFIWGTALSLEGDDLESAARHLSEAEKICREQNVQRNGDVSTDLARIKFELGGVAAQQGDLTKAVELYHEARQAAESSPDEDARIWHALAYKNLAYHLHLLGDPEAKDFGLTGLKLAQEAGLLGQQTYLLSTLGEIALQEWDLETAERYFQRGLKMAEQFSIAERQAGLTANLGRVAAAREQTSLSIHLLSTALARAEGIGTRHLAAQIRIWLAPLLPYQEAKAQLKDARLFAERGGRLHLMDQITQLEEKFF